MNKYWLLLLALFISSSVHGATLIDVVKQTQPKVVTITVTGVKDAEVDFSTWSTVIKAPVEYLGTGSIISKDGFILTCDHLFMVKMENREVTVINSAHKKYKAMIVDEDKKNDLALLKIFSPKELPFFSLGKGVVRGQQVLAFGSPLGIDRTVSVGYVENIGLTNRHLVMHSAAINPGNSGGPLTDNQGRLVGVNIEILMAEMFMRAEGMSIAVPFSSIEKFLK